MSLTKGLYAALPTPFSENGERVNADALGRLVDRAVEEGLDGLYVTGSTGEVFLMSQEERLTVLETVAEAAAGRCAIVAHVGDLNPDVCLRLAGAAARLGYDAFSAVPPFYYPFGFSEICAHYRRLAAAADMPFLVYNFPALSSVEMSPAELAELLDLPNVVGIKNTCADYYAFERLRRLRPEALLFNGFDETLLAGLGLGADGGIGSTYNLMGSHFVDMVAAHRSGAAERAASIQAEVNMVIDVMVEHGTFQSLKFLLTLEGIAMGPCRAPFCALDRKAMHALEEVHGRLASPRAGARVQA